MKIKLTSIFIIGLIFIYLLPTLRIALSSEADKLFIEGNFTVMDIRYVPAVREYYDVIFKIKTNRGKIFFFVVNKFPPEHKEYSINETLYLKIEVEEITEIINKEAKDYFSHDGSLKAFFIKGRFIEEKK